MGKSWLTDSVFEAKFSSEQNFTHKITETRKEMPKVGHFTNKMPTIELYNSPHFPRYFASKNLAVIFLNQHETSKLDTVKIALFYTLRE